MNGVELFSFSGRDGRTGRSEGRLDSFQQGWTGSIGLLNYFYTSELSLNMGAIFVS
jgi:hypothetical protein